MKSKFFVIIVVIACLAIGFGIYEVIFGAASHFTNQTRTEPKVGDLMGTVYTGGPLVAILIGLLLMLVTFIIERLLSLTRAQGRGNLSRFLRNVQSQIDGGNIDAAIDECNKQRGSAASILHAGLERYQQVKSDPGFDAEKKLAETKRAIDEATGLETPLLEKNLVVLSTIASISTMIGLLGTTLGMIRSFQALAKSGQAAAATQLSVGISEALINTAGGLMAAILGIVAYNYFTNRVDGFMYMIEEATQDMMETLTVRTK